MTPRPRRAIALSLAALVAFTSASALAQSTGAAPTTAGFAIPSPPAKPSLIDQAQARRDSDKAARLAKAHLYDAAAQTYLKAYGAGGKPTDLLGAADALRQADLLTEASAAYRALLANHENQLGGNKAKVTKALDEIEAKSGLVTITSEPGATVTIDGRDFGVLPLSAPLRLSSGKHALGLSKPGYEPYDDTIDVTPRGAQTVTPRLEPIATKGKLIVSEKSGAPMQLVLDGKEVGPLPFNGEVEAGPHAVGARGPLLEARPENVVVPLKHEIEVVLSGSPRMIPMQISVTPKEAEIEIDGSLVGRGKFEGPLISGEHQLEARAPEYKPAKRTIVVSGDRPAELSITLESAGPSAADRAAAESEVYEGVYGGLAPYAAFGIAGADGGTCPAGQKCDPSSPLGGGLKMHAGYSLGWVGIHAMLVGFADYAHNKRDNSAGTPAYSEDLAIYSFGGFAGVGARGATHGQTIRLMGSVNGGVIGRWFVMQRNASGSFTDSSNDSTSKFSPGMLFDLGITLGSSPGTKFYVGGTMMLDMRGHVEAPAKTRNVAVNGAATPVTFPPVSLASGLGVYVGPVIGLQFGH